jgi:hypothetical protein
MLRNQRNIRFQAWPKTLIDDMKFYIYKYIFNCMSQPHNTPGTISLYRVKPLALQLLFLKKTCFALQDFGSLAKDGCLGMEFGPSAANPQSDLKGDLCHVIKKR